MIVLSHRGYWQKQDEKNQKIAFKRSFDLGFGTETDVRDCDGKLLISHDMPSGSELSLEGFLHILAKRNLPLAMNIKADGLVIPLKQAMEAAGVVDWFVFDMSIPDMRAYLQAGVPVFTRMSEVEREPVWFEESSGVWLDAFIDIWYGAKEVEKLLQSGKRVCVISPELHKRDYQALWNLLLPFAKHDQLMLCTDLPEEAQAFFGVSV